MCLCLYLLARVCVVNVRCAAAGASKVGAGLLRFASQRCVSALHIAWKQIAHQRDKVKMLSCWQEPPSAPWRSRVLVSAKCVRTDGGRHVHLPAVRRGDASLQPYICNFLPMFRRCIIAWLCAHGDRGAVPMSFNPPARDCSSSVRHDNVCAQAGASEYWRAATVAPCARRNASANLPPAVPLAAHHSPSPAAAALRTMRPRDMLPPRPDASMPAAMTLRGAAAMSAH